MNRNKIELQVWACVQALGVKPFKDGDQWCFLYGEDLQSGVSGFGYTIYDAAFAFYEEVCTGTLCE